MLVPKKRAVLQNKKKALISRPLVVVKDEPLVKSTSLRMPSPKFTYEKDGSLGLSHCELVSTITTADAVGVNNGFNVYGYPVNAGLKSTFPFLSSLASNYKSYEFSVLTFAFIARGNYTRDGAVMFYAEYDPDAKPPQNRIEFLNRSNAVEAQVFKNLDYSLKQKDMRKEKSHYIRLGKIEDSSELKLYDTANLFFAYEGTPKDTLIGDIFVCYHCKLLTPTLRLSEKQIIGIESTKGTGPSSGQTMSLPFGAMNLGSFVGDFAGALLNTATGGLSGQFFTTAKTICKFVSCLFTSNGGYTPNLAALSIGKPATSSDGGLLVNGDIVHFNEDDANILSVASNAANETVYSSLFTDITSTNVIALGNYIQDGGVGRIQTYGILMPANTIMRIVMVAGGSNLASGPSPTITLTDMDPRKLGLLSSALLS
jgi:hypothetical protein